MKWSEVLEDPTLRDLPYKIELNEHGSIVMTPASNRHARSQSLVTKRLWELASGGTVLVECSVATARGVKVPDVAWLSDAFLAAHGEETPYTAAPELCVEIVSPSNSAAEMEEKRALYFAEGAREVWLCDEEGRVEFFTPEGRAEASSLFAAFPGQL